MFGVLLLFLPRKRYLHLNFGSYIWKTQYEFAN
nr:MAG TPA: hypothetical protein [Caudoviricetes sp.]